MKTTHVMVAAFIVAVSVFLTMVNVVYAASPTAQEIRDLLSQPVPLLVVMYVASLASALAELRLSKREGSGMTLLQYLGYWEETLAVVLGNLISFVVLIQADQLNLAAAIGIGYGINNAADQFRKGGRSAQL